MKKDQWKGTVLVYLAIILWSATFLFQKILVNAGMSVFFMISLRFAMVSILLLRIRIRAIPWSTKVKGMILGVIIFIAFSSQTYALSFSDASVVAFLSNLGMIFVPLLYFIRSRKPLSRSYLIAIMLAFFGVYFFNMEHGAFLHVSPGILLSLLSSVFVSLMLLFIAEFVQTESPFALILVQGLTCSALAFLGFFVLQEPIFTDWSPVNLLSLLYLGLIGSLLCYVLMGLGQKYMKNAVKASLITALEPVFTLFIAVPVLNEEITFFKLTGMMFIFTAIILAETGPFERRNKAKAL